MSNMERIPTSSRGEQPRAGQEARYRRAIERKKKGGQGDDRHFRDTVVFQE